MKNILTLTILFAALLLTAISCKKDDPKVRVTSVTLDKTTLTLVVGTEETLTASVAPTNATDKTITWSSSDETIATVDEDGKVIGVKQGEAKVTATLKSNPAITASCDVKIKAAIYSLLVEDDDCIVYLGDKPLDNGMSYLDQYTDFYILGDDIYFWGDGGNLYKNETEVASFPYKRKDPGTLWVDPITGDAYIYLYSSPANIWKISPDGTMKGLFPEGNTQWFNYMTVGPDNKIASLFSTSSPVMNYQYIIDCSLPYS